MKHAMATFQFVDLSIDTPIRLQYAEQGDAEAQPVILIHGLSDSWFSYSRILRALSENYRVYALSLRGHGDSDRPAHGYAMADFAADIVAFMDALGIARATVVGHSVGSIVAQQVALAAPERLERLVLIGAAANPRNIVGVSELKQALDTFAGQVPADFVRDFQLSTAYQPLPADFLDQVVEESLKVPAHVWQAAVAGALGVDFTAQLGRIQAPTLLLWGDQDAYFPLAEQHVLANGLANAVLKIYPDTGHCPHWERPEQVAGDLLAFVGAAAEQPAPVAA